MVSGRLGRRARPIYYFDIIHDYPSIGGVVEFSQVLFADLKRRFGARLISARGAAVRLGGPDANVPYLDREQRVANMLAAADPDATFFFPNFHSPIARRTYGPRQKIINVVHDVQFAFLPELFDRASLAWLHQAFAETLANADEIVFGSNTTRDQFIACFGAPKSHRVIYDPIPMVPAACERTTAAPFLLTVGHSDHHPHKNIAGLLRLFAELAARSEDLQLYATGHGRETFLRALEQFPEHVRRRVHHLGHVPRDELDRLFGDAQAYVSLSRFEGFNLPAAEAACHCRPLILSDLPVHRELFGAEACFVDALAPSVDDVSCFLERLNGGRAGAWPYRAICTPENVGAAYARLIGSQDSQAARPSDPYHPLQFTFSADAQSPWRIAPALRGALLAGTMLSGAAAITLPTLALADGGAGGDGVRFTGFIHYPGGAGGTGSSGQTGAPGTANGTTGGGGGGGSAGGGAGGAGAAGNGGAGGAGGTAGHLDGQAGAGDDALGGGGGGGGGGYNATGAGVAILNSGSPLDGGKGGAGGNAIGSGGALGAGGGGGGAGGYGAIVTGTGTNSNTTRITGGDGGSGGAAISPNGNGGGGGDGGIGVQFNAGGASLTNAGPVAGGDGGYGGASTYYSGGNGGLGGAGVAGSNLTITNRGVINGGIGGGGGESGNYGPGFNGGSGGAGGSGIIGSNLAVTNSGVIEGGNGGAGAAGLSGAISGNGGNAGAAIAGSNQTIVNTGRISGGNGGAKGIGQFGSSDGSPGAGGVGIIGSDLTITNSGAITGGLSGDGVTRANAITFGGGTNRLELRAGSGIVGVVDATAGINNSFALGGSANSSFDVSLIGATAQYRGFQTLEKLGSSTWTLSGQGTYTGTTTINAGKLVVGDDAHAGSSLASIVTVNSGGALGGIGTVAGIVANAGGIVAPGNSVGTLNVAGNVNFVSGSFYQVEVNTAGQSDKIVATGSATLGGGSVLALAQSGTYAPQTMYTILTANGGVTGTFSDVTSNLAFLNPTLSYDANDVFLTLNRNTTSFPDVAQTPNQRAVAGALQTGQQTSPLVIAVLNQSAAGGRQAFDALSGEIHASAQTTMLDDALYLRDAVLRRLRQASFAGSSGVNTDSSADPMAALGSGGPQLATVESMSVSSAFAYADAGRPALPIKAVPRAMTARDPETTFWAQGIGAWGQFTGDGNAAGMRRDLAGFFSGVDHRFDSNWLAGIAGGYTNSSLSIGDRVSSANIDTAHLGGYVGASFNALNLRGGAAASFSTLDTSRSIIFPGFVDRANARYNATTAQVFGEVGYAVALGRVAVEPFAGLAWVHLDTNSFSESGGTGIAALAGTGNSQDVGYSSLGARAATSYVLADGKVLTPRVSVAWQHAFSEVTPTAALAFQSTGAGFTVAGVPLARDAALVEGGLDLRIGGQASVGLAYVGKLADQVQDHSVKGNFTWRF